MNDLETPKTFLFGSISFKRGRKVTAAYALWILVYVSTVLLYATNKEEKFIELWPFLFPLAIVVTQALHPTLFGWILIFIPSALYAGAGIYYAIAGALKKQWVYDMSGFCLGVIVTIVYCLVCSMIFGCRPRKKLLTNPMTNS